MDEEIDKINNFFGTDPKKTNKQSSVQKEIDKVNNFLGYDSKMTPLKLDNNLFSNEVRDINVDLTNRDYINENDNPFNIDGGFTDLNELRANRQGGLNKSVKGLGRITSKVVSEVAKMPGYIGGAIAAPFAEENEGWDTFVNNSWLKSINEANQNLNDELLPVYVKKAVSEGNLWDNISSVDFWATEGADGVGFIASMMIPGAALKALGAGKYISKLAPLRSVISAQKADVVTATIANTLLESAAEAGGAMENFEKNKENLVSQFIKDGMTLDEAEEAFKVQKSTLGRDIFVTNTLILAIPNALQAKMLWGRPINKAAGKLLNESDGTLLKTVINPSMYSKVGKRIKDVGSATVSEGFWEEGMQSTVENMFTKSAGKNELGSNFVNDFNLSELSENYLDTITSTEGQKAMFLGAFLGGGMSAYHGAKEDVDNRKKTQNLLDRGNNSISAFNDIMSNDLYNQDGSLNATKLKEKINAFNLSEELDKQYEDALKSKDLVALDMLRSLASTQLAYGFIMNDELGLDVLKAHLQSNSELDEIVQKEQDNGNNISKDDIIKNTMDTATFLEKKYKDFQKFSASLIDINDLSSDLNNKISELKKENVSNKDIETNEDVIKIRESFNNFKNLMNKSYVSNKASIKLYEDVLLEKTKDRESILEDLDLDKNSVINDERIQKQEIEDSRLNEVTNSIKDLKQNLQNLKELDKQFWKKDNITNTYNKYLKSIKSLESKIDNQTKDILDEQLVDIENSKSIEELDNIKNVTNEIVKQKLNFKKKELEELEQQQLEDTLNETKNSEAIAKELKTDELKTIKTKELGEIVNNPETGEEVVLIAKNKETVTVKDDITGDVTIIPIINDISDNNSADDTYVNDVENNAELNGKSNFALPQKFNETFKTFIDFMMKPLNKKGMKMSVSLNLDGNKDGSNSDKAIKHYESYLKGEIKLNKDLLYNWLPLKFTTLDNISTWSGYPGGKETYQNYSENFTLRKNIVDYISFGNNLENLEVTINGQNSPSINTKFENNKPVKNNPLNIKELKSTKIEDLEIYHVDLEGKLIPISKGSKKNPSAKTKELLSKGKGNVYITIKNPLNQDVPIKLNFSRLDSLASPLVDIYEYILKHSSKEVLLNQSIEQLNTEGYQFEDVILYNNIKDKFKNEIELLGNNTNEITLEQLIEILVLEDSNDNTKLGIIKDNLDNFKLEFKLGTSYSYEDLLNPLIKEKLIEDLSKNKYRNVITVNNKTNKTKLDFQNDNYVKYLFNNGNLTTNIDTDNHSFKSEETSIWLDPNVNIKNKQEITRNSENNSVSLQTTNNETGETVTKSFDSLIKEIEELENLLLKSPKSLQDKLKIKIDEKKNLLPKIDNVSTKEFKMEVNKSETTENKDFEENKDNVKNSLESKKEIKQMIQLNNLVNKGTNLPEDLQKIFKELQLKYSNEFKDLPKKC